VGVNHPLISLGQLPCNVISQADKKEHKNSGGSESRAYFGGNVHITPLCVVDIFYILLKQLPDYF